MKGTLYGVGVGPGDPELLTLQAIHTIQRCGTIAAPDSGSGEQLALTIVGEYIADKPVLLCDMPMTRDAEKLARFHRQSAEKLCEILARGEDVAFLTLGDPSIYSTYMYIHRLVLEMGYPARMVAGVPSFCAAAAALNTSLCEGGEPLHIIPASYDGAEEALALDGNKVLMKSGKSAERVLDTLREKELLRRSKMIQRCSLPDEQITHDLSAFSGKPGYFTLIVVK